MIQKTEIVSRAIRNKFFSKAEGQTIPTCLLGDQNILLFSLLGVQLHSE